MITTKDSDNICSLEELTNQESGIVVYPDGNIVVCNWAGFGDNAMPCILCGFLVTAFTVDNKYFTCCDKWNIDDLYGVLCEIGKTIIWDYNDDIIDLANSDEPVRANAYKFADGVYVFAPYGWYLKQK